MKNFFKKVVCFTIGLTLIVSLLSGCGGSNDAGDKGKSESNAGDSNLVNKTGLPIVNSPTTYKIMLNKNVNDKTTWSEKDCVKKAEAETGLKFDWTEVQGQAWNEKVSVTLAAGDLPDVIIGGISNVAIYLDSFLPLNDLLDTYAPNLINIFQEYQQVKVAITQADGKIYSMPLAQFNGYTASPAISINKAWMDKLNLKMPETTDELYEVLKAFKERDPNGNGKPDEIPYGFYIDASEGSYGLETMMWNFGIVNDGISNTHQYVMAENGKILFIGADKRFYDFLKYMNKLSKEGLIDPDGFIQKNQDFLAKGKKDMYGMICHHSYEDIAVGVDIAKNFVPLVPMQDSSGGRTIALKKMPGDFIPDKFMITKSCKNPEAMVRFWDYVNSSFENKMLWSLGPENEVYKKLDNGKLARETTIPQGLNNFAELRHTRSTGMAGFWFVTTEDHKKFEAAPREQKLIDRGTLYTPYNKKELIPYGQDNAEVTKTRATMFTEIDTYMLNFIAESVLKSVDDTKWNAHLEKLKKLNTDQFVKDYQDYYDRSMALMSKK